MADTTLAAYGDDDTDYFGVPTEGNPNKLFTNPYVFSDMYTPDELPGRDKHINQLLQHMSGMEQCNKHLHIRGRTGTGKTAVVKEVLLSQIPDKNTVIDKSRKKVAFVSEEHDAKGLVIYENCRRNTTRLNLMKSLAISAYGKQVRYRSFDDAVQSLGEVTKNYDFCVVILDEIDAMRDKDSDIIYHFSRWGAEYSLMSLITVSNQMTFLDTLDNSSQSSYRPDKMMFRTYNGGELRDILKNRVEAGLQDGVVDEGIIANIAKRAARDAGDARRAIHTLQLACEIAGMYGLDEVTQKCVDIAVEKNRANNLMAPIMDLSSQEKLCLYAIVKILGEKKGDRTHTGEVYRGYEQLAREHDLDILTRRRITEYLNYFHDMRIIDARQVSRGRRGRTKQVSVPQYRGIIERKLESVLNEQVI